MPTHSTSDTSQGVEAELEKILYGFGNHVWQCAQRHSGWSQEDAQAALLQLIARENKAARKHGYNQGWTLRDRTAPIRRICPICKNIEIEAALQSQPTPDKPVKSDGEGTR